jgi:hypothetical protein
MPAAKVHAPDYHADVRLFLDCPLFEDV